MDSVKNGGISFVVLIIFIYGMSVYKYGYYPLHLRHYVFKLKFI